jgi:putative peptide zinc metalloprotease protein
MILDTSEVRPVHVIRTANGRFVRLSSNAHALLAACESASYESVAEAMTRRTGRPIDAAAVRSAHERILRRIEAIERRPRSEAAFLLKARVLPARAVEPLARAASRLFNPVVAAISTTVALALVFAATRHLPDPGLLESCVAYAVLLVSLGVHELGHAAACARFGVRPGPIGATLYFVYPALYSDVSGAWALKRWQRVVVDLGGAYFQILVAGMVACAALRWPTSAANTALWLIVASLTLSLNPVLKFDGYWVLADLLGVVNLGDQPRRILRHVIDRLRGRPCAPLPWKPWVMAVLVPYTIVTMAFFVWFACSLAPIVWRESSRIHAMIRSGEVTLDLVRSLLVVGIAVWLAGRLARVLWRRQKAQ